MVHLFFADGIIVGLTAAGGFDHRVHAEVHEVAVQLMIMEPHSKLP